MQNTWRATHSLLLLLLFAAAPALAADISVDSDCTLREAIIAANNDAAQGKCTAGSGDDKLTLTADITLNGALPKITTYITIDGDDHTISGDDKSGIFIVEDATLILSSLTVSDGLTGTHGGAVHIDGGALILSQSTLEDNQALDSGGAIYANDANVTLRSSVIKNNEAGRGGGAGIYIAGTTGTHKLIATNSVFTSNAASQDGGAIHAAGGTVDIRKSGFQSNTADEGGVIEIWNGKLIMHNNTLHANSAREGGAINAGADLTSTGSVTLIHNTFTSNTASERGGAIAMTGINATLQIGNTWISGTLASGVKHCDPGVSPYSILGNTTNYIQDNSCPLQATPTPTATPQASIQSAQALAQDIAAQSANAQQFTAQSAADELKSLKLSALQEIEGVIYHELLEGNVAIDAADDSLCRQLDDPDDDVVNTTRPQGSKCDIGAWEYPVTATPAQLQEPTNTPSPAPTQSDDPNDPNDPKDPDDDPDDDPGDPPGGPPVGAPTATPTSLGGATPTPTQPGGATPTPTPLGGPTATPTAIGGATATPTATIFAVPQSQCLHRVVSGDSLYQIAVRYNTTVNELRGLNRLQTDTLHVGQLIDLPSCHPLSPDDPYLCPGLPDGYIVKTVSRDVRCQVVVIADIDKHPLMNAGVVQALDIWGAVEYGVEFCFSGQGTLVHEDDSVAPPLAKRLSLYSKDGMQCALIPASGKVAHVAPLTDEQSIPLIDCQVTTTNVARLLDAPGGSNVRALAPLNVALPASARTANWFLVDYLDQSGWINAALLQTDGACD